MKVKIQSKGLWQVSGQERHKYRKADSLFMFIFAKSVKILKECCGVKGR